jgi:hypothetical protein
MGICQRSSPISPLAKIFWHQPNASSLPGEVPFHLVLWRVFGLEIRWDGTKLFLFLRMGRTDFMFV